MTPGVLDLFSGCGGLSLGFYRAGFKVVGGVEIEKDAAATHARNFHSRGSEQSFLAHARPRDIRKTIPANLLDEFDIDKSGVDVSVIVGGPPCQAYARVGRAKLREIMAHPEAFAQDKRGGLYLDYLRFVTALKPVAILMENVPDILNYGGINVAAEIAHNLEDMGYKVRYTLLNSVYYGVPQTRERFFLLAIRDQFGITPSFPKATHHLGELPIGYSGTRGPFRRLMKASGARGTHGFNGHLIPLEEHLNMDGWKPVSAHQAIGDLPVLTEHLRGESRRGARRFDTLLRYSSPASSPYAKEMRCWPGFEENGGVLDHVARLTPRDYRIFAAMPQGAQYPEAFRLANELFEAELNTLVDRPEPGTGEWEKLRKNFVPPYDPSKFPNKWRKMERDRPARTLMAHLSHDTYSHIHYDSEQARMISVREAARLQSFPDGFAFEGRMNSAFRQIGNAVPPLLAYAIAKHMKEILGDHLPGS